MSTIADKIRKAREHRGLSQIALNKKAGLCHGHISKLESKGNHIPRTDTLQKISDATGIKIQWFVRGIDFRSNNNG